jgi:hypothetical protein
VSFLLFLRCRQSSQTRFSLSRRDQIYHPLKKKQNYNFVYFNIHVFRQQTGGQKMLY